MHYAKNAVALSETERAQVGALADTVLEGPGKSVELVWVDQDHTREGPQGEAPEFGTELAAVRLPETQIGLHFVTITCLKLSLLPIGRP